MMDYLKTCKTNVHLVDNLFKTTFSQWNLKQPDPQRLLALVADLRQRGVLCARVGHELYTFGQLPTGIKQLIADFCQSGSAEERSVGDHSVGRAADGRAIKDVLLEAVECSVSFRLMRECEFLHVGPWKWLFGNVDQDDQDQGSTILLCLILTLTDSGALYATTITQSSRLTALNKTSDLGGDDLVLAPGGIRAKILAQPGTTTAASDDWKANVTLSLRMEGVRLESDADWRAVSLLQGETKTSFLWPAQLCLINTIRVEKGNMYSSNEPPWKTWFAAPEDAHGFRNALGFAEDWFTGAPAREKAAAEAVVLDVANDATDLPVSTAMDLDISLATSPPFAQRNIDQQLAMSGIYPTPPDGLLPSHGSQPPMSDSVPATGQLEQSSLSNELMPSGDDAQARGHTSSSDTPTFQGHTDDLFGDVGGMDFGGDEVGDADFDFFNEEEEEVATSGQLDHIASLGEDHEGDVTEEINMHRSDEMEHAEPERRPEEDLLTSETPQVVADTPSQNTFDVQNDPSEPEHNVYRSLSDDHATVRPPEKPLSPFTIKERLLPPPIPASTVQTNGSESSQHRRNSTFAPVTFNEALDLRRKYTLQYAVPDTMVEETAAPSISLPPKHKKPRLKRPADQDSETSDDTESEEDSYESASSVSDEDLPPKLPWDTKKRKRSDAMPPLTGSFENMWNEGGLEDAASSHPSEVQMQALLNRLTEHIQTTAPGSTAVTHNSISAGPHMPDKVQSGRKVAEPLSPVEGLYQLSKLDLVCIAQLVSEQTVSCVPHINQTLDKLSTPHEQSPSGSTIEFIADEAFRNALPSVEKCDIAQLAMLKEPPSRNMSTAANPRPGQPRPTPRSDSVNQGPDIMPIPPPYVRVKRGQDKYEMLPPALEFWDPLGLTPSNGTKDIRAFAVFPVNDDVQKLVDGFLSELGTVYENCKLGSHVYVRNMHDDNDLDDYEDGLAPVELVDENTIEAALCAYSSTCVELGTFLSSVGQTESERSIVVYVVDPFPTTSKASQYLCACFWQLYKAYRDNIPKAQRNQPYSDIVLQIIPINLIASANTLVTLTAQQLGAMAKEVYDRCPPSMSMEGDMSSALPNFSAPFVDLASPPPKRIGFALVADPPSDLLHEPSMLHLAYATSADGLWMTVAWTDNTGRYHSTASFCLCGKSFAEVAGDVWERTMDIMSARELTWRVFVVTTGELDESIKTCWRKVVEQPRKQAFSVTLLSVQLDPALKLSPPAITNEETMPNNAPGTGFFTPATTPQGTAMTISPDTSGHNAPPTPAPSDSATGLTENDPDAHLVDLPDESWGVLLSTAFSATSPSHGIANGALFKRGEAGTDPSEAYAQLPSLILHLLWTVQVRPNKPVEDGPVKHAEAMLREVLKMYRNLSVLTKARALHDGQAGTVVPVHLASALKGAAGLDGFLS